MVGLTLTTAYTDLNVGGDTCLSFCGTHFVLEVCEFVGDEVLVYHWKGGLALSNYKVSDGQRTVNSCLSLSLSFSLEIT